VATPKAHEDFMGTFSLVHSADMVLRVMAEVRAREDEYDAVKARAAARGGRPRGGRGGRPARRLLHQGALQVGGGAARYAFVFTDVLVVAVPMDEGGEFRWAVDELAGAGRLLEVMEEPHSGRLLRALARNSRC
jgi:hypothetical protein